MFAKPYKLRATNTLKNSEKKSLVQRLQDEYPNISEANAKELVPVKSNAAWLRLTLHSGQPASVLVVDNTPMLIELDNSLLPTVCALWKVPDIVPVITIHEPVLAKVAGGAPLYVPGVVTSGTQLPAFPCGACVCARTLENAAAALVARAIISSGDLYLRAKYDRRFIPPSMNGMNIMNLHGPCVEIVHVYGDQLCRDKKFAKIQRPQLTSDTSIVQGVEKLSINTPTEPREQWPALGARPAPNQPALIPDSPTDGVDTQTQKAAESQIQESKETVEPEPSSNVRSESTLETSLDGERMDTESTDSGQPDASYLPENMNERLRWALLVFIKTQAKHVTLPLKTNLLYKNHLMPLCPAERPLDVKKSSYKKVSKFLEAMQKEGLIELKEEEKGVWAVCRVDALHAAVARVRPPPPPPPRPPPQAAKGFPHTDYEPPRIKELWCVTAAVLPFFPHHKKGTGLTAAEVRAGVSQYVRSRGLLDGAGAAVRLDGPLAGLLGSAEGETASWEGVTSGVRGRMTAATEMQCVGRAAALLRHRLPPVTLAVATRAGNKKVTLVSNLETYGFDLPSLSRTWQAQASAACTLTRTPGASADQILLQGDQTYFVAKTLIEKYNLPKKYVDGADKALAKKKR